MEHATQQTLAWWATDNFMPHGHCYLWVPELLWTFVISESIIVLSYFSIPFALLYLVRKRTDLQFNWMFKLFSVFIFACGITHLLGIWTIWYPDYWLDALVNACTAAISLVAAILLWRLIPQALKLPTTKQLEDTVTQLQQEVVQRKAVQAELVRLKEISEQRFLTLFGQDAVGVAEIESSAGSFLRVNHKYCELLGYGPDEMLGISCLTIVHPDEVSAMREKMRSLRAWEQVEFNLEQRQLRKDGSIIWVHLTVSPMWQSDIAPSAFIVTIQDVSARKKSEQLLKQQLDELQRWHDATLGRETRVMELKREVNALLADRGELPRYLSVAAGDDHA